MSPRIEVNLEAVVRQAEERDRLRALPVRSIRAHGPTTP
jgi:hypothetical protein